MTEEKLVKGSVVGHDGKALSRRTTRVAASMRFSVLSRDGFRCKYCGRDGATTPLEVDHVTPLAHGGVTTPENLVTACSDCNVGKAAGPV